MELATEKGGQDRLFSPAQTGTREVFERKVQSRVRKQQPISDLVKKRLQPSSHCFALREGDERERDEGRSLQLARSVSYCLFVHFGHAQ